MVLTKIGHENTPKIYGRGWKIVGKETFVTFNGCRIQKGKTEWILKEGSDATKSVKETGPGQSA